MGKIYDDKKLVSYYMAGGKMPNGLGCGFFPVFLIGAFIVLIPFMLIAANYPIWGFLGGEFLILGFVICWHWRKHLVWKAFLGNALLYSIPWALWVAFLYYQVHS